MKYLFRVSAKTRKINIPLDPSKSKCILHTLLCEMTNLLRMCDKIIRLESDTGHVHDF